VELITKKGRNTKFNFISSALLNRGWKNKITMETKVQFTDGKITIKGNATVRKAPKKVDYFLYINSNRPVAIVEAKGNYCSVFYELQQTIFYVKKLDVPFASR